jgi:hypothetical protein
VPGALLRVRELPEQGRPAAFRGAVGPVSVAASLEPGALALGGSARLSILLEGEADLFGLPPPFDPEATASAELEILTHPAELARDAGRRLRLRRWYHYDLVPRRTGSFELPAITVGWFDPVREGYALASAPPLRLVVTTAEDVDPERSGREGAPAETEASAAPPSRALVLAGLAASLLLAGLALAWRMRRRGSDAERSVRAELERAGAARVAGEREREHAALARALRLALEAARVPGARSLSTEELRAGTGHDPELLAAVELLARLDRARFAGETDAGPAAERVANAVRGVLARGRAP